VGEPSLSTLLPQKLSEFMRPFGDDEIAVGCILRIRGTSAGNCRETKGGLQPGKLSLGATVVDLLGISLGNRSETRAPGPGLRESDPF
jgi:hypothetical protein